MNSAVALVADSPGEGSPASVQALVLCPLVTRQNPSPEEYKRLQHKVRPQQTPVLLTIVFKLDLS